MTAGTATVGRSYLATSRIDPGFDTSDTLTLQLTLPRNRYPGNDAHVRFASGLASELEAIPGVARAGVVSDLPFVANAMHFRVAFERQSVASGEQMTVRPADPGYFDVLGLPRVDGRVFTTADHAAAPPVALVNRTAASRLGAGFRPGARLQIAGEPP